MPQQTISQPGLGFIDSRAITFCGDAIGEAIPATSDAKAIPNTNALATGNLWGYFLKLVELMKT